MMPMDPEYARLLARDDKKTRDQICDWLHASGIDPGEVPIDATITIRDNQIVTEVWVRDGNGKHVIHGDELVTTTITRRLCVPPTGLVAEWLAARSR